MTDTTRCGGFVAEAHHERCPRRFDCARFLDNDQARPFRVSACEGGDSFIHVATVAQGEAAAHPQFDTPKGVTNLNATTTTRG